MKNKRLCGGCKACCTTNEIVELRKPVRTHCDYECKKGCSIYNNRPQSCKDFNCLWLLGHGENWARPDKIGFFIEERDAGPSIGLQYFIKEVKYRSTKSKRGKKFLQELYKETKRPIFLLDKSMQGIVGVMGATIKKKE